MQNKHACVSQKEVLMTHEAVLIANILMYGEIMRWLSCRSC
jgi:hypothetical protein